MYSYNYFERLFCAINWKAFLLVFRLRNSVCRTKFPITCLPMVQGYPQEDSSRSGFRCSLPGIRNEGNSFPNPGWKAGSGYSAFFG